MRCEARRSASCAIAGALVMLVLFAEVPARALTVSVAEFRLTASPETEIATSFIVFNDEPRAVEFSLTITDWDDGPDGVTRLFPVGEIERSCGAWLDVDVLSFSLAAFEERTVNVRVRVPAGVHGTHWAGLVVRAGSPAGGAAAGIDVIGEALVRLFVTVSPAAESATVTGFSTLSVQPLRVLARIANTGDARLVDVQGLVSVEGPTGQAASFSLSPLNLLPGHSFDIEAEAPWGLDMPGLYLVRVVFDYGAESLVAGQIVVHVP
ncbi:MAG: hypothetical protein NTV92_07845 [Candidatus Bipolaricaulota bacterium]|nr:hypothetical protein [Candidatus Bipolaricaulota bacterium]